MTKLLKRRFIITAMAAVTALLVVVIGAINIVNFTVQYRRTAQVLDQLSQVGGVYTPPDALSRGPFHPLRGAPSPDDMMGARYFTVRIDRQGNVIRTDLRHILSVSEENAKAYAEMVLRRGRAVGYCESFRFQRTDQTDGESLIVFLDASVHQRELLAVGAASLLAGIVCWLLMLLLITLLSKRAIAPIAESIEKQKQFVTNAGHELKTPLAIIQANTDALELHSGESKWSRNIRAQVLRLDGLMKNLLILAKMDELGGRLSAADFSMTLLLEELLDQYRELAQAGQVELDVRLDEGVTLRADRGSVAQMVSILLDNAIKYTPAGGTAAIALTKGEGGVVFRTENPCATPVDEPERLFERFYRADGARTQKTGGYGIGLSAARAIAQANGGRIVADYEDGRLAFTVRF